MLITALIFLLILSVLVLIHELGHFLVAKKLGIKVEEFGFGFPPRALSIKRGETVYSINWLPIGGFVKLYGEDEAGGGKISVQSSKFSPRGEAGKVQSFPERERAFFSKPVWQRALVVIAGVAMNALLAVVIFYVYLFIVGFKAEVPLLLNYNFVGVNQKNVSDVLVSGVSKNSPAEKAGIKAPARITSINNISNFSGKEFFDIVNKNKGKEVIVKWVELKTNQVKTIKIVPRVNPPKNEGALGIRFAVVTTSKLTYDTIAQKVFSGITYPTNLALYNFKIMGHLISLSLQQKTAAPLGDSVAGPVGIFSVVGTTLQIQDLKERITQVLNIAGLLSISLAVFNILPIPALDGGRLFFILLEGLIGKKVSPRFESMVHTIGMAVLLALIFLITFKDISRLLP